MNLSKETEAEILLLYHAYWDAYLRGDIETFASYLDDHIVIYGTAVGEIFTTKEDAIQFYTSTADEMTGKAEFRNREISIHPVGDSIAIYEQSQLYVLIEDTWTFYGSARITGIFEKKGNTWILVHQHGSFPDGRTEEGQQIASEKIKEENLQLREAVQRRTIELENKTRELEIESSLERVRAVAMGMRKPDDMLAVCEVIAGQLQSLGIHGIRNVQTAIVDEGGKGTYMNYQYFTQYEKGIIEHVDSARHPKVKDMITQMQASPDAFFSHSFEGNALEEWKQYRNDDHQFPDPILEKATSLHFYFYSIGQGGLGLSAYSPLTENNIAVFHKFRNVFALAYQRFRDIQQAEAQAREAQIELAMERVRARTMAMQHSDELSALVKLLYEEFDKLKMSNESTDIEIGLIDEETGVASVWAHFYLSDGTITTFKFPFAHFEETNREFQEWKSTPVEKRNQLFFTTEIEGERWQHFVSRADEVPELAEIFRPLLEAKITKWVTHNAYFSHGILTLQGTEVYSAETLDIQKRFAKVFEQTYTRFLDLQKAEAQAREAKIETALEKVRSRTMAMQRSDELTEASEELYRQLTLLGEPAQQMTIGIINEAEGVVEISATLQGNKLKQTFHHPISEPYFMQKTYNAWKERKKIFIHELRGDELIAYNHIRNQIVGENLFPVDLSPDSHRHIAVAFFSKGILGLATDEPRPAESIQLLERFATVFDLTYTRFQDLQKAEAQAREARIEASLERVRSIALGMRKADDLLDICEILYTELEKLDFQGLRNTMINILDDQRESFLNYDYSPIVGKSITPVLYNANSLIEYQVKTLKASNDAFVEHVIQGEQLEELIALRIRQGEADDPRLHQVDTVSYYFYSIGVGAIGISSFNSLTEEQRTLLRRFRNVFEFAYRRYMDIAQAEASAREARIEASLERVRAKAMAMHSSEDLSGTIGIFYRELKLLSETPIRCGIALLNQDTRNAEVTTMNTTAQGDSIGILGNIKMEGHKVLNEIFQNWMVQKEYHVILHGNEINAYYQAMRPQISYPNYPTDDVQFGYYFMFKEGYIYAWTEKELGEEDLQLYRRFANVISLTYKRYKDLIQAEANAREARIEAGLERVRSRTLAMHKSDELAETAAVVFRQLIDLGIAPNRLYIAIIHDDNGELEFWITDEDGARVSTQFLGHKDRNDSVRKMYDGWASQKKSITISMEGKELQEYFHYLSDELHVPFRQGLSQKRRVQNIAYFSKGFIGIASPDDQPEETTRLLERFAAVFNLTYTRFSDLQHAEAQTHKAKIEVALERVRARALAMQQPEELVEVAQVMRQEMGLLGIEELETSSIYIHDKGSAIADCWYAIKDIRDPEKKLVADHITMELDKTWVGRQMLEFFNSKQQQKSIVMKGTNRIEWINYCSGISDVLGGFYGDVIPDRTYHLYKFSNGAIGAAAEGDISDESWELLRRATSVFSLAYSRFRDLTQARVDLIKLKTEKQRAEEALAHLKAAQTQLIQSEKMASLGELTAGIAHEIQNPLNFVNNFSEVNTELIEEMKEELLTGNTAEALAIAKDIADNEQKINHHGKRADAIVKGMLQHSRSSSGIKEPTDINALADEYLRLAYHGLRAKDKSFNATMKTDFDESIGKVEVIPQDIGRVMLNLITNAFYAVTEKQKSLSDTPYPLEGGVNYLPTVTISTKISHTHSHPNTIRIGGRGSDGATVTISVSDNGPGIPDAIKDKIFQPFFTTKPTGQGTGLGLSLSYDILKAHGGDLQMTTSPGEGTTFTMTLPA